MTADDFDANYQKLLAALDQAVALLEQHSEQHWAAWLATDRARIAEGDRYALDNLLLAFGGMGSFNDLVLQRRDQKVPFDDAQLAANRRLREYRRTIWAAAKAMQRELNVS